MIDEKSFLIRYVVPMLIAFVVAAIIHRYAYRIIGRFVKVNDLAPQRLRMRTSRQSTLRDLLSSSLILMAYAFATLFSMAVLIDKSTLVWMIGLFSAAFGFGAWRMVSDFITGINFIFEDTLDVGDMVEILGYEGIVERINLRTLQLRGENGELLVIPNGEIRVFRNFSRGRFSTAKIVVKVPTEQLDTALPLLERLGEVAVDELINLLEPWEVIGTSQRVAEHTELMLLVKAKFGKAAELRPRLQKFVRERLQEANVTVVD